MRFGTWFYGLATIATGILNIIWGTFEASHQPIHALGAHIPGEHVLAYLAGICLIAAGGAVLWPKTERTGLAASAALYVIFACFWLPRFYTVTHALGLKPGAILYVLVGCGEQLMLAAPAAIAYATDTALDLRQRTKLEIAARWLLGLPPIAFGLGHLVSLQVYTQFCPHWLPFPKFWLVFTGLAFISAGLAFIAGKQDVLAAWLLALMFFIFEFTVELPPAMHDSHNQVPWGGALFNITAIGACLIFAECLTAYGRVAERKPIRGQEVPLAASGRIA